MLGAIFGDIVGSAYEFQPVKNKDFALFPPKSRFTDDTVMLIALMESILDGAHFGETLKRYYRLYPHAGYGERFQRWAEGSSLEPYGSFGNGAAARVIPVGFSYHHLEEVMSRAAESARVTHDHPEGMRGAMAVAATVFLARRKASKAEIQDFVQTTFGYDLRRPVAEIRPGYGHDQSCQGTVPQAIRCFLESDSFEDAIRNAISLGGDADTLAAISGGVAEAHYGFPVRYRQTVSSYLDERMKDVLDRFYRKFSPDDGQRGVETLRSVTLSRPDT